MQVAPDSKHNIHGVQKMWLKTKDYRITQSLASPRRPPSILELCNNLLFLTPVFVPHGSYANYLESSWNLAAGSRILHFFVFLLKCLARWLKTNFCKNPAQLEAAGSRIFFLFFCSNVWPNGLKLTFARIQHSWIQDFIFLLFFRSNVWPNGLKLNFARIQRSWIQVFIFFLFFGNPAQLDPGFYLFFCFSP